MTALTAQPKLCLFKSYAGESARATKAPAPQKRRNANHLPGLRLRERGRGAAFRGRGSEARGACGL